MLETPQLCSALLRMVARASEDRTAMPAPYSSLGSTASGTPAGAGPRPGQVKIECKDTFGCWRNPDFAVREQTPLGDYKSLSWVSFPLDSSLGSTAACSGPRPGQVSSLYSVCALPYTDISEQSPHPLSQVIHSSRSQAHSNTSALAEDMKR